VLFSRCTSKSLKPASAKDLCGYMLRPCLILVRSSHANTLLGFTTSVSASASIQTERVHRHLLAYILKPPEKWTHGCLVSNSNRKKLSIVHCLTTKGQNKLSAECRTSFPVIPNLLCLQASNSEGIMKSLNNGRGVVEVELRDVSSRRASPKNEKLFNQTRWCAFGKAAQRAMKGRQRN